MDNPFDPNDRESYLAWRARKLAGYPSSVEDLRVDVERLAALTDAEAKAIRDRIAKTNMALVRCADPGQVTRGAMLRCGQRLGLQRLDNNLCADEQAVSVLSVRTVAWAGNYIPYTNRPLSWHTDGYYNAAEGQVRSWMLFCVRDALAGGENALFDHELAYIRLRDADVDLIRALMDADALTIPANVEDGRELRPARTGPVFSLIEGHLHMRYSARGRNVRWKESRSVATAREALSRLFSQGDVHMFRHKLSPGEGYVTNNVLHNRTGFEDGPGAGRVLLRTRYLDRIGR
jgi:hypothetical protein